MSPRRSVTLVTGPTSEPLTLSEAKAWARIDGDTDDALVAQLITTVTLAAEEYLRRSLISRTYRLTLDQSCSGLDRYLGDGVYDLPETILYGGLPQIVELPKGPVSSITSVTTYDTSNTSAAFSTDNYRLDSAGERLILNYGSLWPSSLRAQQAVEIVYVAGYGSTSSAVPQPIKTGMLIHLATLYEQRGQCGDAMDIPPGTRQMYDRFRVMGSRG